MIEYPLEKVDVDVGVVLEPLMEYHVYVVTVAASTDKGFGNYSLPLDVLTDEHGRCDRWRMLYDKMGLRVRYRIMDLISVNYVHSECSSLGLYL